MGSSNILLLQYDEHESQESIILKIHVQRYKANILTFENTFSWFFISDNIDNI